MATKKKSGTTKTKTARKKKLQGEPASRGLEADALAEGKPPPGIADLIRAVEGDRGTVIGTFRDPVGGNWQLLAALPLDRISPTPFQRDLSETHVARLTDVIHRHKHVDFHDRFHQLRHRFRNRLAIGAPGGNFKGDRG